jgi:hypothetical protein
MKVALYTGAIIVFLLTVNTIYLSGVLDLPPYDPEIIRKHLAGTRA